MLTEIEANSPVHAEKILREKIKIDQITELPAEDVTVESLKNMFGMN
jgi:ribosomal protein L20A (L18A)